MNNAVLSHSVINHHEPSVHSPHSANTFIVMYSCIHVFVYSCARVAVRNCMASEKKNREGANKEDKPQHALQSETAQPFSRTAGTACLPCLINLHAAYHYLA